MIVDLRTLDDANRTFDFEIPPESIELGAETVRLTDAVRARGEIKKGIVETKVSGEIRVFARLECTRCLTEVEQKLEFPFEAAFVAPEHYTEAVEAELSGEDLDVSILEGNGIDLAELVREQILLNLPEQVFCRDDCRGLCPKCGANLNLTATCGCEEKEIDPRWAALKDLKP
jgi:uncharacterized protein